MSAAPQNAASEDRAVPEYVCSYERPTRSKYVVSVFVINEGDRIRNQLRKMASLTDEVDVIVADGGSTDGSLTEDILQETRVTALLTKTGPGKLSAQMRMAFDWALKKDYDGIVTIDGNGKDGIEAIPSFVARLKEGWDHIQGSRFIPGGYHEHTPLSRLMAVRLLHAPLISLAAGFRYTDTTNGFRAYSRRFLEDPRVSPFRDVFGAYELHYYLAIRAARLRFRTCELPVSRVYPATGKAPTKISPFRGNLLVLKTLLNACRGKYNPDESAR